VHDSPKVKVKELGILAMTSTTEIVRNLVHVLDDLLVYTKQEEEAQYLAHIPNVRTVLVHCTLPELTSILFLGAATAL
jgi:hypothetical protein